MPSAKQARSAALHPRLRVVRGEEIALGPGKADQLGADYLATDLGSASPLPRQRKLLARLQVVF